MKFLPLFGAMAILSGAVIAQGPAVTLKNVAQSSGVTFTLDNSPTPEKHLIESVPGGVAAFDYNGDGRVDLFFTNGAVLPTLEKSSEKYWNRLIQKPEVFEIGVERMRTPPKPPTRPKKPKRPTRPKPPKPPTRPKKKAA